MDKDEWYRYFEGIVHSYKQHIDILTAETTRGESPHGRPTLRVDYEIGSPGYPTSVRSAEGIRDGKRALFLKRLIGEDDANATRVGDGYVMLVKR